MNYFYILRLLITLEIVSSQTQMPPPTNDPTTLPTNDPTGDIIIKMGFDLEYEDALNDAEKSTAKTAIRDAAASNAGLAADYVEVTKFELKGQRRRLLNIMYDVEVSFHATNNEIAQSIVLGNNDQLVNEIEVATDAKVTVTTKPSVYAAGTLVVGDGSSEQNPACSWKLWCDWDQNAKDKCAKGLCQAAGYASGELANHARDPCKGQLQENPAWLVMWDQDLQKPESQNNYLGTEITAVCFTADVCKEPWDTKLPAQCLCGDGDSNLCAKDKVCKSGKECIDAPAVCEDPWDTKLCLCGSILCGEDQFCKDGIQCIDALGTEIFGDGSTEQKPACSWKLQCDWNTNAKEVCAKELCQNAGFQSGEFVDNKRDPCKELLPINHAWLVTWDDQDPIGRHNNYLGTEITAKCFTATDCPNGIPAPERCNCGTTTCNTDETCETNKCTPADIADCPIGVPSISVTCKCGTKTCNEDETCDGQDQCTPAAANCDQPCQKYKFAVLGYSIVPGRNVHDTVYDAYHEAKNLGCNCPW